MAEKENTEKQAPPKPFKSKKTSRQGTFKFVIDRKTIISNKKILASLANNHVQGAVAFVNRSTMRLREAVQFLAKLDAMERRLLSQELLDEDAERDEQEDHRLVHEVLEHLKAAQKSLEVLRLRKIEAGIAFEEAVDPIYKPAPGKKVKPFNRDKPDEVAVAAQPMTMGLVEVAPEVAVPAPAPVLPVAPVPVVVKFDEDLLQQARRELSQAQELKENGI